MNLIKINGLITCSFLLLSFIPIVSAQPGFAIFESFEFLDLSWIYDHYSTIIDLFIYIFIFVGLAQVTLGRHFPGRGGQAISIGTGISLALAMVIAEENLGFSLKSFGPVAGSILILLMGIVIYKLLHYINIARHIAISIAYIVMFLVMYAVVPWFFEWLYEAFPIIDLLSKIVLFVAIIAAIALFFNRNDRNHRFLDSIKRTTLSYEPRQRDKKKALEGESQLIKHRIKPIAKKALKDSNEITNDLQSIAESIRKDGSNPKVRRMIANQIARIIPKEHSLQRQFANLKDLNNRIMNFDASLFSETSKERVKAMSNEQKAQLKADLHDDLKRLGIEKKLNQLEVALNDRLQRLDQYLKDAVAELLTGEFKEAFSAIRNALSAEKDTSALAKDIKDLEQKLRKIIERDLKS